MKALIISIGNSKGIRIPKLLLEESGVKDEVELKVKKGEIRILPVKKEKKAVSSFAMVSEKSFAKDWLRTEEEEAWKVYQSEK
jgi:antitoxin MazE